MNEVCLNHRDSFLYNLATQRFKIDRDANFGTLANSIVPVAAIITVLTALASEGNGNLWNSPPDPVPLTSLTK